ncbi:hypothetical protein SAMN05216378_3701 [Paenibacillus catalpae]|uniref:DUF4367 domain-containing protein n=1 Tax=Paenibacillus catalpae TaxID=1045775 RepID=A0A1I2BWQ9_9BACL|nr:hypothetical protein [Paenibacillus catalpae]SFE60606.1 hypothetical protein SAMN05216378_3701 [Paenibacillus catalpae]
MFRIMLITVLSLTLLNSSVAYAENIYPYDKKINGDISSFENHIGQDILIPTWIPPEYDQVNVQYAEKEDHFSISYAMAHKHDGIISLLVQNGEVINTVHFRQMTLRNGRTAFYGEHRLRPFHYVPREAEEVFLYFYDGKLLYTLSMASRAFSSAKMKRILIKVANSMN